MKTYSNSKIVRAVEDGKERIFLAIELQGEFWKLPKEVVVREDFPGSYVLRYVKGDGIYDSIAFWYRITGKNFQHWGYTGKGNEIMRVKCQIIVPNPDDLQPEFGAWLYLEELEV